MSFLMVNNDTQINKEALYDKFVSASLLSFTCKR
uniref:Uncharacterized protein n=1 Tax=Medicago truncatula TaxID=3880 RepID=I3SLQ9_MEDTR|nr:unknown [Medicago truncatula]